MFALTKKWLILILILLAVVDLSVAARAFQPELKSLIGNKRIGRRVGVETIGQKKLDAVGQSPSSPARTERVVRSTSTRVEKSDTYTQTSGGMLTYYNGKYGFEIDLPATATVSTFDGYEMSPFWTNSTTTYAIFALPEVKTDLDTDPSSYAFGFDSGRCPYPETEGHIVTLDSGRDEDGEIKKSYKVIGLADIKVKSDLRLEGETTGNSGCYAFLRGTDGFLLVTRFGDGPVTLEGVTEFKNVGQSFRFISNPPDFRSYWNEYRSDRFGFSFLYPSGWRVTEVDDNSKQVVLLNQPDRQNFLIQTQAGLIISPLGEIPWSLGIDEPLRQLRTASNTSSTIGPYQFPIPIKTVGLFNDPNYYLSSFISYPRSWNEGNFMFIRMYSNTKTTFEKILSTFQLNAAN